MSQASLCHLALFLTSSPNQLCLIESIYLAILRMWQMQFVIFLLFLKILSSCPTKKMLRKVATNVFASGEESTPPYYILNVIVAFAEWMFEPLSIYMWGRTTKRDKHTFPDTFLQKHKVVPLFFIYKTNFKTFKFYEMLFETLWEEHKCWTN